MNQTFTFLTYNVHEAVGSDHRRNYSRIVDVIHEINPDIMALQEVDVRSDDSIAQKSFLFETVTSCLPYFGIKGITLIRSQSAYGNALFFRNKPEEIRRHDISYGDREPRGVLDCILRADGTPLRILNTHFGLNRKERARQVQLIKHFLKERPEIPSLLAGDFNEWCPFSRQIKLLRQDWNMVPCRRTFPSRFPVLPLDRIFFNHRIRIVEFRVHNTPLSRSASDHRPLIANFYIR